MAIYNFPENFMWGSATSAHQVEGGNHNDWSEWEKSPGRISRLKSEGESPSDFISGLACDSYNRYEEDFDIAKKLNHNIHRFSIEWSRIEPEEGKFNDEEIEHYKRLIDALRERGIEPMVTLWHFTNPVWFTEKGGWLNRKAPEYFTRYVKHVVDKLKDRVGLWITFNEATTVWASLSYLKGEWPPQRKNIFEWLRARRNFMKAHVLAYQEIKNIYRDDNDVAQLDDIMQHKDASHNVAIGLVENNAYFSGGLFLNIFGILKLLNWLQTNAWLKTSPFLDFIGLNYYTDHKLAGSKEQDSGPVPEMPPWRIYPKGIYHRLMALKKFKKPIYITENGIADKDDRLRDKFIKDHLYWIWKAIDEGADVRGYMYWSLLDNFEWARGFAPRFGLAEVDCDNPLPGGERKIRPSAYEYAKICKDNQLQL